MRVTGIAIVTLLALAGAPSAATARWVAPVGGAVTRGFAVGPNPFAGGQHRGADFAAAPGADVRAACAGEVVVARRVGTSGRVVTIRCGPWRVTHQPLAEVAVAAGGRVARGARIGTVAPARSHAGLHLGVRRDGRRFGYVDPLRFLGSERPPPVVARPRAVRRPPALPRAAQPLPRPVTAPPEVIAPAHTRTAPHHPVTAPADTRTAPHHPVTAPADTRTAPHHPVTAPADTLTAPPHPVAPWPVWAGLALLLAGAGVRWRRCRRREPLPVAVAQEVR